MICGEPSDLLSILLEEPQLETLVQLQLPHVPQLLQILPRPVELIQQSCHLSHQVVHVSVLRVDPVVVVVGISAGSDASVTVAAVPTPGGLRLQPLEEPTPLRVQLLNGGLGGSFLQPGVLFHEPPSTLQVPREVPLGQDLLELLEAGQSPSRVAGKRLK